MINEHFVNWLKKNNWIIERSETSAELPAGVRERYSVPGEWLNFVRNFSRITSPDDTVWFLTPADFLPNEGGFSWDEFERISLSAAEGDETDTARIKAFWDRYLPIIMSVRNGYEYYAIDTLSDDEGHEVVHGFEPEFEECEAAAADFGEFLEKVISGEIEL